MNLFLIIQTPLTLPSHYFSTFARLVLQKREWLQTL